MNLGENETNLKKLSGIQEKVRVVLSNFAPVGNPEAV